MTSIFLDADSSFLERNSASTSTGGSSSASAAAAVAFSQSLLNSIAHAAASVSSSSAAASASSLVTGYNWYYDKSEFRRVPSIVNDGISYERERRYRNDGARFILNVGSQMKLRYTTLATGVVYFHRFYMFHSFNVFPRYVTAACCLFLAGKAEETPKKCKDIIKIARTLLTDQQFATFGEDPKEEVLTMERIVLQTIRFDLQVEHPYKFLVNYAKSFKGNKEKIHNVLQMAWTFTNDSLCTTINLQWEPEIVAIAMLFLASKIKYEITDWEGRLPHHKYWWDMYVEDLTVELLEDVCHQVLDLYQRPQNPGRPMDSPMHSPAGAAAVGPGVVGPIPNNHHPINSHTLNLNNNPNSSSSSNSLQPPVPPSTGLSTDPTTSALQPPPPPPPPRAPIPPPNVTNASVYVGQPPPPPSSLSAAQQQRFGLIGTGANSSMINSQANSLNSLPPPPPPPIPPQWDPNIASFYHHQPQGYNFPFPGGPGVPQPPQHPGVPNAQMMQSMGPGGVMQHSRHQLHPHHSHSHPPQPHHSQMGARLQQQHPPPPPPPQPPMMPNLPASFLQQNQRN